MWDNRRLMISSLIPDNSNVIDLGSNTKELRDTCSNIKSYKSVDYNPDVNPDYVADFNKGEFPDIVLEDPIIVCAGLLEYLDDIPNFLDKITKYGKRLIFTYFQTKCPPSIWKNNFRYVDIIQYLNNSKWKLKHIEPLQFTLELVFVCEIN